MKVNRLKQYPTSSSSSVRLCPVLFGSVILPIFDLSQRLFIFAPYWIWFTGEVLGFHISNRHDALLVKISIQRAVRKCGRFPGWFHSDQGSEYASEQVQAWLVSRGTQISMSPKSSPWWNGSQESFFGRFKLDFGDVDRFETLAELLEALYCQLHYHSNIRIKSKLKMSPAAFREKWAQRNSSNFIHSPASPDFPRTPSPKHSLPWIEGERVPEPLKGSEPLSF